MRDTIDMIHRAIDLSDTEDYRGAIRLLDEAIAIDPTNAQAFFERGVALSNLDQDAEAADSFARALEIDSEFPGARHWRARTLEALGDHQAAAMGRLEDLRRSPEGLHSGMGVSPQRWADCAEAFIAAGDAETARSVLMEYFGGPVASVTRYRCYSTAPMRVMARILLRAGELESAFEYAADAARHEHSCPADQEIFGIVLAAVGRMAEAEEILLEHTRGLPRGVEYMEDLRTAIAKRKERDG